MSSRQHTRSYTNSKDTARHDIPDRLVTDNGPPFNSHRFTHFTETWGFEHITSSPTYAQSNGKAENAVKQAKLLILKAQESKTDPYLALLELRNIPSESMKTSPAQRLFSRRTQTQLPTAKTLLKPQTCTEVTDKLYKKKEKQAKYYNRDVTELSTLKPGQTIRVQMGKKWVKAKVEEQVDIRSYRLRTEDGKQYRRNRKHLRTTQENWSEQPTNHEKHNTGDRILRRINDTNGVGNGDTAQKEITQNTRHSVPTKETETTLDTVNKPAEQQNVDKPAEQQNVDRPAEQQNDDKPTEQQNDDKPTEQQNVDRPAEQQNDDKPAEQQNDDKPAEQQNDDKPAEQQNDDKPAEQQNDDKPAEQQNDDRPAEQPEC